MVGVKWGYVNPSLIMMYKLAVSRYSFKLSIAVLRFLNETKGLRDRTEELQKMV